MPLGTDAFASVPRSAVLGGGGGGTTVFANFIKTKVCFFCVNLYLQVISHSGAHFQYQLLDMITS